MATTADFKNGMCLNFNGNLVMITEFLHVKPGKGPAFVRTKLKNLKTGRVVEHTFNSGVKVEPVRIELREYQFLYKSEEGYNFMNNENFEQVVLSEHLINSPQFLKEGETCNILFHAEEEIPLSCELPPFVVLEITYTEPGIKGDTATNASKKATLETGAIIQVPLFINNGEKIKIDTRTSEYSERAKS